MPLYIEFHLIVTFVYPCNHLWKNFIGSGVLFLALHVCFARWNFMTNSAVTWDVKDKVTFFEVCITVFFRTFQSKH